MIKYNNILEIIKICFCIFYNFLLRINLSPNYNIKFKLQNEKKIHNRTH